MAEIETFEHRGILVTVTLDDSRTYNAHAGGRSLIVRRTTLVDCRDDARARINVALENDTMNGALWRNDTAHWKASRPRPTPPVVSARMVTRRLAVRCAERATALGLGRGKKADDAALHYFCGAAVLAEEQGDDFLARHLAMVCVTIISLRGMAGVRQLITGEV